MNTLQGNSKAAGHARRAAATAAVWQHTAAELLCCYSGAALVPPALASACCAQSAARGPRAPQAPRVDPESEAILKSLHVETQLKLWRLSHDIPLSFKLLALQVVSVLPFIFIVDLPGLLEPPIRLAIIDGLGCATPEAAAAAPGLSQAAAYLLLALALLGPAKSCLDQLIARAQAQCCKAQLETAMTEYSIEWEDVGL
jgi:hypothetical protein